MPEEKAVTVRAVAVALVLAVCSGCAATGPGRPESPTEPATRSAPSATAPEPANAQEPVDATGVPGAREADLSPQDRALDQALRRAIERGGRWNELHLLVECAEDGVLTSAEVFGNGVTIWNGRRQSTLGHERLVEVLLALRDADFPSFLELYGKGQQEPVEAPPASALQVICRVNLTLDGITKQSAQRAQGPQSAKLEGLAWKVLDLVRPAEGTGMTADDLEDGLAKVADGRLAPESLALLFHRKPELGSGSSAESPVELAGFLLRLDGRLLSVEEYRAEGGYAAPRTAELDREALAEVTGLLTENRVEELPDNLWAEDYTDLVVEVLDRSARVQARQFARMTPTTHAESQKRFDRIAEALETLARTTLGVE